jgi:serine/threonine protein phosphatase PrpC
MGGHRGGETASRLTVESIGAAFETTTRENNSTFSADWLAEVIREANREVHAAAQADTNLRGMGTTVVSVLIDIDGRAFVSHVGDSRAYLLRDGKFERLTDDHSVGEMQRRGMLTEEEAARHPRRNEILRSVGVDSEVEPETRELELQPGDSLMLCSDGLCGVLNDTRIHATMVDAIAAGGDEENSADELTRIVAGWIAGANDVGGPDNITAQLLRIPKEPRPQAEDPSAGAGSFAAIGVLGVLVAGVAVFAWVLWH